MDKSVLKVKEISVGVTNRVGALTQMMSFLVNHSINIEAIAGSSSQAGDEGNLIFITSDNDDALRVLAQHGYTNIEENEVLVVELENKPGTLKNISELLAINGINIDYLYCTTCNRGCPAKVVLSTTDNDKAFQVLSGY